MENRTPFKQFVDNQKWYHYNTGIKSIHIRNIDEEVLDALKILAKMHHRSLQGELYAILEQAAKKAPQLEQSLMGMICGLHVMEEVLLFFNPTFYNQE